MRDLLGKPRGTAGKSQVRNRLGAASDDAVGPVATWDIRNRLGDGLGQLSAIIVLRDMAWPATDFYAIARESDA